MAIGLNFIRQVSLVPLAAAFVPLAAALISMCVPAGAAGEIKEIPAEMTIYPEGSTVYFGVVGTGPGLGRFGHAFLMFGHPRYPQMLWPVYDYAVEQIDGQKPDDDSYFLLAKNLKFVIRELPLSVFEEQYRYKENRTIEWISLKLSLPQISELKKLVGRDALNPKLVESIKYHPYGMNCASRIVEHLRAILPEAIRPALLKAYHNSVWHPSRSLGELRARTANALLGEVPIGAMIALKNSSLFGGESEIRGRRDFEVAEGLVFLKDQLNKIAHQCLWTPELSEVTAKIFTQAIQKPQGSRLGSIVEKMARSCPQVHEEFGLSLIIAGRLLFAESDYEVRRSWLTAGERLSVSQEDRK